MIYKIEVTQEDLYSKEHPIKRACERVLSINPVMYLSEDWDLKLRLFTNKGHCQEFDLGKEATKIHLRWLSEGFSDCFYKDVYKPFSFLIETDTRIDEYMEKIYVSRKSN